MGKKEKWEKGEKSKCVAPLGRDTNAVFPRFLFSPFPPSYTPLQTTLHQ